MTIDTLNERIKELSPTEYNSIIIDNASAIKRHTYCFITASSQHVDYRTQRLTAAIDEATAEEIKAINGGESPYSPIAQALIERMKEAPKYSAESFLSGAKKKFSELMNGGRTVDHGDLKLKTKDGRLTAQQPAWAIKAECGVAECAACNGRGIVETTDGEGMPTEKICPQCNGRRLVGTLSYFIPTVSNKNADIIRCAEGEIENLRFSAKEGKLTLDDSEWSIEHTHLHRIATHNNGIDEEEIPEEVEPYMEALNDKLGEENALTDMEFTTLPCYTFSYRNVLTSQLSKGVYIDYKDKPVVLFDLNSTGKRLFDGMRNRIKTVGRFFGGIGKTDSYKDGEDLRRTLRLMIAIVVADGTVSEDEKRALTLSIRNVERFTDKEKEALIGLLGNSDASFLNDEDYRFHSRENAEECLLRMQEIATADGTVQEAERDIIERLKFKY